MPNPQIVLSCGRRPLAVVSAAFSALLYVLFWDGEQGQLANKGGVGVLINLAILVAVLILRWPNFEF